MKLFAGRRGDECIIFRDQGTTDPHGGPQTTDFVGQKPRTTIKTTT